MAEDAASSLRAAALLSLKSKRRTAAPPALPTPSASKSDAVVLTYDDPPPVPDPIPSKKTKESGKVKAKISASVDQADVDLEDGEISDENEDEDSVMKDGPVKTSTSTRAPPSTGFTLPTKPTVGLRCFMNLDFHPHENTWVQLHFRLPVLFSFSISLTHTTCLATDNPFPLKEFGNPTFKCTSSYGMCTPLQVS